MDIKEKAKLFAIQAHMGQIRKNEPDKPMIMHPISVGVLLESFGYDDNVVAAGYLHDVVEDTKYTIEDIKKEFGSDIASLVMGASEPDKSLSWEERKRYTILEAKNLPFRNKLVICADNEDYYVKLKKLHAMKVELQRLKSLSSLDKPFVIEFSGTPRTGKTTTINNLYDFFKKGGFDVALIEEFTTSKYYKEYLSNKLKGMSLGDSNIIILEEVYKQLQDALELDKDIILIDRSINDRQIWNYRRYRNGEMPGEQYFEVREKYKEISKELIDFLLITFTDPITSLKRDYLSSLALEQRSFLNEKNIADYNSCLHDLQELFSESVDSFYLIDTSHIDINDVASNAAFNILPVMRKKYIKSFERKYNL